MSVKITDIPLNSLSLHKNPIILAYVQPKT